METDREECNRSQALLSLVLSNAPLLVFALDRDGLFTDMEGQGLDVVGRPGSFFVGRSVQEMYADQPEALVHVETALSGSQVRFESHSPLTGWTWDVILVPDLDGKGLIRGVIGIAIDITEKRQAEAARRESEAKSRFLAAMSHELRTPLNSILGFSQLLKRESAGELNARQRRYLEHINSSGEHLLELINDVLDLTKIHVGQIEINLEVTSVRSLAKEAIARVFPLAEARAIHLSSRLPPGLAVRTDPRRLHQVLGNLLSNAIKFTPEGGSVKVAARQPAGRVEIRVSDTGLGIDPADQERIFEEFTQVEAGLTRSHQGTGLGLTVSRRLTELLGGTLTVESAPGQGATFVVTLPAA